MSISVRPVRAPRPAAGRAVVLAAAAATVLALAVATTLSIPSTAGIGVVCFIAIAVWMFLSERLVWPCIVLGLYLGLLDGFLKLRTGASAVSLGRDVLLLAIASGFLVRAAVRGQRLPVPPLVGWVIAYVLVVLVQLLNPGNVGVGHTLGALKPGLEFVPLFFIGYALMQTPQRLRAFFVLLTACALINGIVAFVQLNMTPEQLAGWGPGYSEKVFGTGDVSGRVYFDETGQARTRPFGLGSDSGAGGLLGMVSIGAALALMVLAAQRRINPAVLLLSIGPPLAIITGQGRTAVIAGVVAILAFVLLATSARRLIATLSATLLFIGVTIAVVSLVSSSSSSAFFERYKTITPTELQSTTSESRGSSLSKVPRYMLDRPLGAGLGLVGPAGGRLPPGIVRDVDGETQFTFLLTDLGVPGLLILLGFNLRLLGKAAVRVPKLEPEVRTLLAGVAAGLTGVLAAWFSGAPMSVSPTAPYFWFSAGILAFWLADQRRMRTDRQPA